MSEVIIFWNVVGILPCMMRPPKKTYSSLRIVFSLAEDKDENKMSGYLYLHCL